MKIKIVKKSSTWSDNGMDFLLNTVHENPQEFDPTTYDIDGWLVPIADCEVVEEFDRVESNCERLAKSFREELLGKINMVGLGIELTEEQENKMIMDEAKEKAKEYDYINPSHYKKYSFESIEMMEKIYGPEKVLIFCELSCIKYRLRMGNKPGEDIRREIDKINWYENKILELKNKCKK